MYKEETIPEGTSVRHRDTRVQGNVTGTVTENGNLKQIVRWTNGRITFVKAENLEVVAA